MSDHFVQIVLADSQDRVTASTTRLGRTSAAKEEIHPQVFIILAVLVLKILAACHFCANKVHDDALACHVELCCPQALGIISMTKYNGGRCMKLDISGQFCIDRCAKALRELIGGSIGVVVSNRAVFDDCMLICFLWDKA